MSKRWLLLPLALLLIAAAVLVVIPLIHRSRTCDDFPAPIIAAGSTRHVALSCWDRVTFENRVYAGGCLSVRKTAIGDYLRRDLDGPRLKFGITRAVREIERVPVTEAIALEMEVIQGRGCKSPDMMIMFGTELADGRFEEIRKLVTRKQR